jgi:hypothetical protein
MTIIFAASNMGLSGEQDETLVRRMFILLEPADRRRCSLVSKRWHRVDGQAWKRLSLQAWLDIGPALPALLERFQHVTKLTLKCDPKHDSIDDNALCVIGQRCQQLQKLRLKACKGLMDNGIDRFAQVCGPLQKFSCAS